MWEGEPLPPDSMTREGSSEHVVAAKAGIQEVYKFYGPSRDEREKPCWAMNRLRPGFDSGV